MPNLRISELAAFTPVGTEYLECIIPPFSPGTNRRILVSDVVALAGGGSFWPLTGAAALTGNVTIDITSRAVILANGANDMYFVIDDGGGNIEMLATQNINQTATTLNATTTGSMTYDAGVDVIFNAGEKIYLNPTESLLINGDEGTATQVLTSNGPGVPPTWENAGGGGGTPGGSNTQVQYNNAGAFGGISGATTNGTILSVTTAAPGTNTTQAASTAFVTAAAAAGISDTVYGTSWQAVTTIGASKNALYDRMRMVSLTAPIVPAGSTVYSFGTSITAGVVAIAAADRYPNILSNLIGTTTNNQGVSATNSWDAVKLSFTITTLSRFPTTIEFGLNDMRGSTGGGAGSPKAYEKVKGCLRAFFASQFISNSNPALPANSGSITQGGTWTTVSSGTIGERASNMSGLALQTAVNGSTLTCTRTGSSLIIGTFGTDDSIQPGGTFTVTVDGVLKATFNNRSLADGVTSGAGNNNAVTQNAVIIEGLGTGSHTVVITVTSLSASGKVFIDYIGALSNPNLCQPVICLAVPKMNAAGYATGAAGANDAVMNQMDDYTKDVIDEFIGFPVYWSDINLNFDSTTDLQVDNIHRNELGHSKMAQALFHTVSPYNTSRGTEYIANPGGSVNGYFGQTGGTSFMGVNRNPLTGAFDNTGQAAAVYHQTSASGQGSHEWYTTAVNNTAPALSLTLNQNGNLINTGTTTANGGFITASTSGYISKFSTTMEGYFVNSAVGNVVFYANRHPTTGTFFDVNKAASGVVLGVASGLGEVYIQTSPTNNTAPTITTYFNANGMSGFGAATSPTDTVHITLAGTTSRAPMRFTSGSLTTGGNIRAGQVQFLTDKFYGTITTGPAAFELTMNNAALTSGTIPVATTNGRLTDSVMTTVNHLRVLVTDTTTTGNVTTGEDTLQTYSLPAATLGTNGNSVRGRISGFVANNANSKTLRLKFGGTTFMTRATLTPTIGVGWTIDFEIIRTGATTQKCNATFSGSDGVASAYYATAGETLSGAINIVLTGDATATDDIVKETFKVVYES